MTWLLLLSKRHTYDQLRVISRHSISLVLKMTFNFIKHSYSYMYISKKSASISSLRCMFFALLFFHYQLTNKNATGFITSRKKKKEKKKYRLGFITLPNNLCTQWKTAWLWEKKVYSSTGCAIFVYDINLWNRANH